MQTPDAARLIKGLALRPGYELHASVLTYGWLELSLTFDTYNSNERYAPDYARGDKFTRIAPPAEVYVADMSETDVLRTVMEYILTSEAHEWREFLRYRTSDGRWVAPFHPHQATGNRNWITTETAAETFANTPQYARLG